MIKNTRSQVTTFGPDYYIICEETDPESYPMTHSDVPKSRIIVPKVDINTISDAIQTVNMRMAVSLSWAKSYKSTAR